MAIQTAWRRNSPTWRRKSTPETSSVTTKLLNAQIKTAPRGRFYLSIETPQLGWGFSKAFSFEPDIKKPFDLLKHLCGLATAKVKQEIKRGVPMGDEKSLAHTRWNCKYHIVFAPKYRRQVFYGEKCRAIAAY